jgi:hypothetical protein
MRRAWPTGGCCAKRGEYTIWSSHVVEDKYCVHQVPCSLVDGLHSFGKLYCLLLQEISRVIRKMDVCTQVRQSRSWMGTWKTVPGALDALPYVSAFITVFGKMQKSWRKRQCILCTCCCQLTQTAWKMPYYGVNWHVDHLIGDSSYLIHLYHQHYRAAWICSLYLKHEFVAPLIIAIGWQVAKLHLMSDTCVVA